MSPLDDELRRTLSARAATLAPSPDPLTGIESRARGIRRRRVAASVAGAVAAVAAVAIAVPSLSPDRTTTITPGATPSATTSGAALDPAHPWAFRGTPLSAATVDAFTREWQTTHPGGTFTPLWSQVYEPSRQVELVFLGSDAGRDYVGWGSGTESGPSLQQVEEYTKPLAFFQFAVPGDEGVRRLYVVGAPGSELSYAQDGVAFTSMAEPAPAVGVVPLEGSTSQAKVRVKAGGFTYEVRAEGAATTSTTKPANLLTWEARGQQSVSPSVLDLKDRFAQALGRGTAADVSYRALFVGDTDSGVHYTMGQAWFDGETKAYSVSYATGGTDGPHLFLGPPTPANPPLLAFVVGSLPGTSVDLLVVIPDPRTGQVSYDTNSSGGFTPVADGRSDLNGVALIDRAKDATNDRLEVLDGGGDLDHPLYRGPVQALLCGVRECG